MGQMTNPKPLIIIIWTCQEMMAWMGMELIGSMDVILQDFGTKVGQITAYFKSHPDHINLTQHYSHGPDDQPKTIDYHHLDMSRDDGMDEHRIGWLYVDVFW
jgi:hypothetical protein